MVRFAQHDTARDGPSSVPCSATRARHPPLLNAIDLRSSKAIYREAKCRRPLLTNLLIPWPDPTGSPPEFYVLGHRPHENGRPCHDSSLPRGHCSQRPASSCSYIPDTTRNVLATVQHRARRPQTCGTAFQLQNSGKPPNTSDSRILPTSSSPLSNYCIGIDHGTLCPGSSAVPPPATSVIAHVQSTSGTKSSGTRLESTYDRPLVALPLPCRINL